jgi:2-polyprenyl-3-methyl-5-hydroxy-6-metoxy-1,4-benzoquinol methylase
MSVISAAAYHSGKYLAEEDLLPEYRACPWCGFSGARERAIWLQRDPDVALLECPKCHAFSASRAATDSALAAYYGSYYSSSVSSDKHRVTCGNPQRHARHILRYARSAAPTVSLLDFGGGDGSIGNAVAMLLARPTSIVVVDYNDQLATPGSPQITLSHVAALEDVQGAFDLVFASAVLEHLPEPAETTRHLLRALKPGGFFYARTPCVVPVMKVSNRLNLSYDFTFPAHFHDLGQKFWDNLIATLDMDAHEWRVVASRPSVVETSFSENVVRTAVSYAIKAPWWIFRGAYTFTGGWEVFVERRQ